MFRVPPLTPGRWWALASWQRYARACFEYYSRRKDFVTLLTDAVATADVSLSGRRARFNPELPPLDTTRRALIREQPTDDHERHAWTVQAYCAHEAGHVRHSGEKPLHLLGFLVNCLEDERMEALQTQAFPHLGPRFTFLGDHFLLRGDWQGDALEGCLVWRWQHDFPHTIWSPTDALWPDVRPLVEAAWVAPSYDTLVEIARWILKVLGRDQDEPVPTDLAALSPNGSGHSGGPGTAPQDAPAPPDDPAAQADLDNAFVRLSTLEGDARTLAALLHSEQNTRTTASRSRGRYRYDRAVRGCERVFVRKEVREVEARRVQLLLDLSGSMSLEHDDGRPYIDHAVDAALTLLRACDVASVPLAVTGFDGWPREVKPFSLGGLEARLAVAGVQADGSWTRLAPALKQTLHSLEHGSREIVVLISDGDLDAADVSDCQRLMAGQRVHVIPILIGDAATSAAFYRDLFGRYVTLRPGYSLSDLVRTYLRGVL